jgi:hypothetical protein
MLHGIAIWFGLTNPAGHAYLFWSGIGGDLGLIAVPLVAMEYIRRNTCDIPKCYNLAKIKTKDKWGDSHSVCQKHRPETPHEEKVIAEKLAEVDERPLKP